MRRPILTMTVSQSYVVPQITYQITAKRPQVANPSVAALYEDALVYESGSAMTSTGALTAYSGAKTGRSPLDKRIVKEEGSEKDVWWGPVNRPMSPDVCQVILSSHAPQEKIPSFKIFFRHLVANFGLPRILDFPSSLPCLPRFSTHVPIFCPVLARPLFADSSHLPGLEDQS